MTEHEGKTYRGLTRIAGTATEQSFEDCTFVSCKFSDTKFLHCRFCDCTFVSCDFSGAKFNDCELRSATFKQCKLQGVNFADFCNSGVRFTTTSFDFYDCNLRYCSFVGLKIPRTHFEGCDMAECELADCNLQESTFCRATLKNAAFRHCDLRKADFTGAKDYVFSPADNLVKGASFDAASAIGLLVPFAIKLK